MRAFLYRLFGYWVRLDACKLAAATIRETETEGGYTPRLWSLAVFYENYLCGGSSETAEDFGPKDPVSLAEAKSASQ